MPATDGRQLDLTRHVQHIARAAMPCFLKGGAIETKRSVLMGSLGKMGDQFVLEGYKPDVSFAEKIRRLS